MNTKYIIVVSLSVILGSGCVMEGLEDLEVDVVYQPVGINNDSAFNSALLNGTKLNGTKLNGTKLNGTKLNGVQLSGTVLSGVHSVTSQPLSGNDFIGTDFDVVLEGGGEQTVRIADIVPSGIPGMRFFDVQYYSGGSWQNLCNSGQKAIPVNGTWDPANGEHIDDGTQFTFACRGAAIAKCLEWGYQKWDSEEECDGQTCKDQSLRNFHRACIRMVRADYCGDGVSHTENGTLIDAYDALGIMADDTSTNLDFEAEWTKDGASCIKHTRWENSTTDLNEQAYIQTHCPSRWVGPDDTECGSASSTFHTANGFDTSLSTRTLFHNESNNNFRY